MLMTRRTLLWGSASVVALAACTSPATLGPIFGDVNLIVTGLQKAIQGIETADPTLIKASDQATINTALTTALSLVNGLSSATPTSSGASTVQTIDTDINTILDIAAALPVIPPPYSFAVQAAAALAPLVEAFVNSTLRLAAAAPPGPRTRLRAGLTPEQGRAQLQAFVGS
jgi:hypothetical protein